MNNGIILVSHVQEIGEGIYRLIQEVAKDVSVTIAAGIVDSQVGTSFDKILEAIEQNSADTILAFYDLGSAKMNLEMALEFTDKKIMIFNTAFVESAYTAAALLQAQVPIETIESQLSELIIK